jgi:pimeloyl-ACP methyl ester carboxylesterase
MLPHEKISRHEIKTPPRWQMLFEVQAAAELVQLGLKYRELTATRAQFGHPIMLFPGFGTSERALSFIKAYLKNIGAEVFDWGIGRNHGYVPDLLAQAVTQVQRLSAAAGKPIHLVGWSLGGYIAREVARDLPDAVARVVTLGTPVIGGPKFTSIGAMYAKWGFDLDAMERDVDLREQNPIQKEILAIYSKGENIVRWQACIDERSPLVQHREVNGSHLGLVVNARAYELLRQFLTVTKSSNWSS